MRWYSLAAILVAGMAVITGRLFWLTVVKGGEAVLRAEGNRVEWVKLPAPRGIIYDRNDEALVRNAPGEEANEVRREYVYGEAMAHVLGYVGESDGAGKMGVEKWLDEKLRGQDGAEIVETGADGKLLRRLGRQEPVVGEEVRLTIDAGLQRKIAAVMGDRKGGVVVTTPQGEILAVVSSPGFEPERVSQFLDREDKPLFNRATDGVYPPGSIFKLVTAVAGLETGKINEAMAIEDTGEIRVGEFRYGNWYFDQYGKLEGSLDIVRGLGRSNDVFFYRVGEMVGAEELASFARRLGLGQSLDLGWAADSAGLVPDPAWKEKFKGERWFLGNTYHLAIGQGDVGVTLLQVNLLTGVLGNSGRLCKPQILHMANGKWPIDNCEDLQIGQKTLELVKRGMAAACAPGGTAFPLFDVEPQVACKTGTAQHGGEATLPHAWITVLAPSGKPELVITVLLEAGGEGSYEAAPVARQILEYWFHERQGIDKSEPK